MAPAARLVTLMMVVCLAAAAGCRRETGKGGARAPALPPEAQARTVIAPSGAAYRYVFFDPPGISSQVEVPLLCAFHGAGGRAEDMVAEWAPLARRFGFVVAAPQSVRADAWEYRAEQIDAMLAEVAALRAVDRRRRYVTGFSAGGHITYFVGCTRSDEFAALAPMAGGLDVGVAFLASRKTAAYVVHGTSDSVVTVNVARESVEEMRRAGHLVEYVEHGGGHDFPRGQLEACWHFLVARRLP